MRAMGAMLCLAACSLFSAPVMAATSLTGTWFGYGQPDSKDSMYLDRFLANGQLHSRFRDCINGKPHDSTEDGNWAVKGDILTIQVARHNGIAMPRTDVYRLTSVTAQGFKDIYLALNFPFDEHRVEDSFTMPSCQLVS